MVSTSKKVEAAGNEFIAASAAYRKVNDANKDNIAASLASEEFKAYDAAKMKYERLSEIEQERDYIQREIYIRHVSEHGEDSAYKMSIKEANAYTQNKYGEEID